MENVILVRQIVLTFVKMVIVLLVLTRMIADIIFLFIVQLGNMDGMALTLRF